MKNTNLEKITHKIEFRSRLTGLLRNPYNTPFTIADSVVKNASEQGTRLSQSERATLFYGLYCQALIAVKEAIKAGADTSDLVHAIDELGAERHLLDAPHSKYFLRR
ncbi:hypothetical protein HYS50_00780 [Candidatus Woesearchaeota archaeon]|nr:hypothetical protein [Candidatus Woesearchaeota archaeon]